MISEKTQVMNEIQKVVPVFKRVPPNEYRIRCPICGDSQKNLNDSHCYIKCSNDPSEPLLYFCQKCNASGMINGWFLSKLGVNPSVLTLMKDQRFNKINSPKFRDRKLRIGSFDQGSFQIKYIEKRLGRGFTEEDYEKFKIIWSWKKLKEDIEDPRIRNSIPSNNNSISFLSDNGSMVLTRPFDQEGSWRKINLFDEENKSFYTIGTSFDLFTENEINVSIAEGIFDILSIYKNFNYGNQSVYIATLGSDYVSAIEYVIAKGVIGTNVIIRIYIDSDINEDRLIKSLEEFKWLFKSIYIYKNLKSKDVGVKIEDIKLAERRI